MDSSFRPTSDDMTSLSDTAIKNLRRSRRTIALGSTSLARTTGLTFLVLAGSLALSATATVQALPVDGVVAAGQASIATSKAVLTVNQSSQNAVINWQSFGIGAGEAVKFQQPNTNSVALNRVVGGDPSQIIGSLSANGKVFLVNPNGILFAKDAQVNVGGLVASTLGITDANFMAGTYKFSGSSAKEIINQGTIAADGGYVALLGANVSNQGIITAQLGTVVLAAGSAVTLDVAGDGLLNVTIDQGAVNALVRNGGLIKANGGQVVMTARGAGQLIKTVVNNTGVIEAQSIDARNGRIMLLGDAENGGVSNSGNLTASGLGAGQTGGQIAVTGAKVALRGNARLDASGAAGGGTVLIGGGYQGKSATVANAKSVKMGKNVTIAADAVTTGDGGKVVLWSDGATKALGKISARGGAQSGNGGLVETSGKTVKTATSTSINTLAPNGKTGLWLLDPVNYTIATSGGDETPAAVAISLASTDRLITATNDVTVANDVTWSTPQTLTLNAGHDVLVNAAITGSTAGAALKLIAGHDVTVNGVITSSGIANLVQLTAGNDININAAMTASASGAVIETNAGHDVIQSAAVTASGGGAVIFRADMAGVPGPLGGTVKLSSTFPVTSTSRTIYYSPENGYGTPNLYPGYTSFMWTFVTANDKVYDGTTAATARFFGDPTVGGTVAVGLTGGTIAFTDKNAGPAKPVTFSGYSLNGAGAAAYALFTGTGPTTAAITPAPLTVTSDSVAKTYGTAITIAATAFTSTGLVGGDTIAGVTQTTSGALATAPVTGSPYAITPSAAVGGTYVAGNYSTTYLPGALTVTPAALTVTANGASKTYGTVITFAPTAFTSAGLQNGDTIAGVTETSPGSVATAAVAGSPYVITASSAVGGTYVPSNYITTYLPGALTVTPAALTITADSLAKTYGTAVTLATTAFTSAGLKNGDTIAGVTETGPGTVATAPVAGSPYVITASSAVGGTYVPSNYTTTYLPGVLTVTPAPLNVTADSLSKLYGAVVTLAPTAFTSVGLQNGDTIAGVTETSPGTVATAPVAGSPYVITATSAVGGTYVPSNYTTTYFPGVLTVTPAPLSVTADSISKTYGTAITLPTTTFTTVGLKNGDTVVGVTETSPGTVATAPVAGTPYVITPSGEVGGTYVPSNYITSYVPGVLTVTPLPIVTPPIIPPVVTPPVVTPPVVIVPIVNQPDVTPPDTPAVYVYPPDVSSPGEPTAGWSPPFGTPLTGGPGVVPVIVVGGGVKLPPQYAEVTNTPPPAMPAVPPANAGNTGHDEGEYPPKPDRN